MSSPYYDVTVVEREGCRVVLDLQCIHPDYLELPDYDFFAVMVIRDGAKKGDPIATAVTREQLVDTEWDEAGRFIRSVHVFDVRRPKTPPEAESDSQHPYWFDAKLWPAARYEIEVTDPAWVRHLRPKKRFESYAFGD